MRFILALEGGHSEEMEGLVVGVVAGPFGPHLVFGTETVIVSQSRLTGGSLLEVFPTRGVYKLGRGFVQADCGLEVSAQRVWVGVFRIFGSLLCVWESPVCIWTGCRTA